MKKLWSIIKKILVGLLIWFSILVLIVTFLNLTGISGLDGLWSLLWLFLVGVVPIALSVLCMYKTHENTPFYQKWWVWLIGAVLAIIVISLTTEPAPPNDDYVEPQNSESTSTPTETTTIPTTEETTVNTQPTIEASEETTTPTSLPIETAPNTTPTIKPTEPPSPEDNFINSFCKTSGLKQATAGTIYRLLRDEMHFEEIQFKEKNPVGQINWDVIADGYTLMLTADDDGVYRITCGSFTLYQNAKVALTKEDMLDRDISTKASFYYVIAKEIVSQNLSSPSSAKFATMQECAMQRKGNIVAVQGYVEAKNAFGVKISNKFIVQFWVIDAATYTYQALYIEIGNQSTGEFVDMK